MVDEQLAAGDRLGPYEVLTHLGSGGMGAVYQARDTRLGRLVAIKVSQQRFSDRFEREARAIGALNHPNICTLYDVGPHYLVMEFITGRTLRYLSDKPQSLALITQIGTQVAQALATAHAIGLVHRDIKPENIIIREDGLVKLLDFGLARSQLVPIEAPTQAGATESGLLVGTLRYMSPEQARCEMVSSASDIFSLGLVLYELCTGSHPFAAASAAGTLAQVVGHTPDPPQSLVESLPPSLSSLVLHMLEKSPGSRPAAPQVLASLQALGASAPDVTHIATEDRTERQLVGRDRELEALRAGLRAVYDGSGLLMTLAGEAGLGKTTLAEEFVTECAARGCWTGMGRCSERLAGSEAYLPVLEALESLRRADATGTLARSMRLLAPTWSTQVASASESDGAGRPADVQASSQERLKMELAAFLTEAGRVRPIVLLLDDLHWADLSTVELLAYLATHFTRMRLLIVGTYRPSDLLLAQHTFGTLKLDLQGRGGCHEIVLNLLNADHVETLIQAEFPNNRLGRDFATRIHGHTGGSPLFVVDVLRYLKEHGGLQLVDGSWEKSEALDEILNKLPESVQSMIQRTIERLNEDERSLLVLASVQGQEFDSSVVARAGHREAADVEEALEAIERKHGILTIAEETELADGAPSLRCRFTHGLYQNAFYATLRPTRRMQLSAVVAQAMLDLLGDQVPSAALGLLYETGRDFTRATHHFLLATRRAAGLFANAEAYALARRGLASLARATDVPERQQVELELNLQLGFAATLLKGYSDSEVKQSMTRGRELCAELTDQPQLASALFGLFMYYIVSAELSDAQAMSEQLIRVAEDQNDDVNRVAGHTARGIVLQHQGKLLPSHEQFDAALALYHPSQHAGLVERYRRDMGSYARCEISRIWWLRGYPDRALSWIAETVRLIRANSDVLSLAFALVFDTFVKQFRREAGSALDAASTCIALCDRYAIAQERVWVEPLLGWALVHTGRADQGLDELQRHRERYRNMHSAIAAPYFRTLLADALLYAGEVDNALEAAAEGLAVVEATGQRSFEPELRRLRGEILLAQGADLNAVEAAQCFERALGIARQQGARSLELRAATSLARLSLRTGDTRRPKEALRQILDSFTEGEDTLDLLEARRTWNQLGPL